MHPLRPAKLTPSARSRPSAAQGRERPPPKAAPTRARGAARRHLPWLWRRRGRRSAEGTGPLPPAPPGRPCAAPSPRAADTKRGPSVSPGLAWGTPQRAFPRSSATCQRSSKSVKRCEYFIIIESGKAQFCIFPTFIRAKQTYLFSAHNEHLDLPKHPGHPGVERRNRPGGA